MYCGAAAVVEVHQVGKFIVKGQSGPVEMVEVALSHLAARRHMLAEVPPKSQKGRCIQPLSGHIASVFGVRLPAMAQLYRQLHEQRKAAASAVAAAATATAAQGSFSETASGSLTLRQRSITARAGSVLGSIAAASSRAFSWGGAGSLKSTGSGASSPRAATPQVSRNAQQQQQLELGLQEPLAASKDAEE